MTGTHHRIILVMIVHCSTGDHATLQVAEECTGADTLTNGLSTMGNGLSLSQPAQPGTLTVMGDADAAADVPAGQGEGALGTGDWIPEIPFKDVRRLILF